MEEVIIAPGRISKLLDLARKIEAVAPGLGIPITYTQAARIGARYSKLGRGILVTAEKGKGKSLVVEGTSSLKVAETVEAHRTISRRWLKKRIFGAKVKPEHLSIIFEDLAPTASNRYHLDATFDLLSWAVSNRKFSDKSDSELNYEEGGPDMAHEFSSFSAVCGGTPRVIQRIMSKAQWPEMWSDRFSRLALLYRAGDLRRIARLEDQGREISSTELRGVIEKAIPKTLPETVACEVSEGMIQATYRELLASQHTERRGRKYMRADLSGLAVLNGTAILPEIVSFARLAAPYLQIGALHPRNAYITQLSCEGARYRTARSSIGLRDARTFLDMVRYLEGRGLVLADRTEGRDWRLAPGPRLAASLDSIKTLLQPRPMGRS